MSANGNGKSSLQGPLRLLKTSTRSSSVGQLAMATDHGRRAVAWTNTSSRLTVKRTLEERGGERANYEDGAPGEGTVEQQCGADARRRDGVGTFV